MFKNTASQKIALFAFDTTSGVAQTGDAANIVAYLAKDYSSVSPLADTSPGEMDSANAPGWYVFDLTQSETNGDALLFTGISSTPNIAIVGQLIHTLPTDFSSKVDQLTFSNPNELDTNIRSVNDIPVDGDGTSNNPWGPI